MLPAVVIGLLLIGGCASAPQKQEARRWSCNTEVYELAQKDGSLFARTSGGILTIQNNAIKEALEMPRTDSQTPVDLPGDGAFVSATVVYRGHLIASYWGGKSVFAVDGPTLSPLFDRPPAEGDYALLDVDGVLYAGTNNGLYKRGDNGWNRIDLGGELPFPRVHGIAKNGKQYVIGGIDGVAVGSPGNWKFLSHEPVRQVLQVGNDVWILYGSGAVDKLAADGRLFSDVLYGAAKRPWSSAMATDGDSLLIGGHGGWMRKGAQFSETYPPELSGEVVTAIMSHGPELFVGTQSKGLARLTNGKVQWINPGTGLSDTWVTGLCVLQGTVLAATASAGLFEIRSGRALAVDTPSQNLRNMSVHKGSLVIGGLDGAWLRSGSTWKKLETDSQETTFIATTDDKLWVGTPMGVYIDPNHK